MPQEAPPNSGAPVDVFGRVAEMQAKLHRWAAADPGRRFDDLFNLVYDPATLSVAFSRVAGNRGANTAGVDGITVTDVAERLGVPGFLDDLRVAVKGREFRPLPVRERMIPKPGGSGKLRRLGIPTIADRVVQAALKLVLEPLFEADFLPVSYGFRPKRRAQDAIADIHRLGTQGYRWVLDADIEACFDMIDHTALMDRVRRRIKDKRVLTLVKAFLKAGIMTEAGRRERSDTGTPQSGITTPPTLLAISSSRSRWVTGGLSGRGVSSRVCDMSGCMIMACLVVVVSTVVSSRGVSTRRQACSLAGSRLRSARGSWPSGSAVRPGRRAATRNRPPAARSIFPTPQQLSPSNCPRASLGEYARMRPSIGWRSPPWLPRHWWNTWPGRARPGGHGDDRTRGRSRVRLRPPGCRGSVGGLRHPGATAPGPYRVRTERTLP